MQQQCRILRLYVVCLCNAFFAKRENDGGDDGDDNNDDNIDCTMKHTYSCNQ